jgi:hypothetical protein
VRRRLPIPILLLVATSCVHEWGRTTVAPVEKGGITFGFPAGWMAIDRGGWMVATRDGTGLQLLAAGEMEIALTTGERGPDAVPRAILQGLAKDLDCPAPEMGKAPPRPAPIAEREGLRADGRCRTAEGPETRFELAWLPAGRAAWFVAYAAPARHYFDQDAATFERTLASVAPR